MSEKGALVRADRAAAVLDFWFGAASPENAKHPREAWFRKDPAFDRSFHDMFVDDYHRAASGAYDSWMLQPEAAIAGIILLDQFPRNVFRDEPRAFATDPLARAAANDAIRRGFDVGLPPVWRWFVYLPFQHSESLDDQQRSMQLTSALKDDPASQSFIEFARRHLEIIQRFGRFPHRNQILGRQSTAEELAFLQQPGSSF